MGTKVQKQFLNLGGKPVLWYALYAFENSPVINDIILVTGADLVEYCQREIVEKYGLDAARPQWRANTVWAGLLIAVGNEYVKSNPKPVREKRKAVEALCAQPEFAKAIRELRPKGLGRNKQIVADLIGSGRFGTLTALYRLKNHM